MSWWMFMLFVGVVVAFVLYFRFFWKYKRTVYCHHTPNLSGRVVIVTGANSGIGRETARVLARRGARVILACRSVEKGRAAADDIRATVAGADVMVKRLDLSSLQSVKEFADHIRSTEKYIDILINNAGLVFPQIPYTEDGFEMTFASNHLGHFLLTRLLLDMVEKSETKRVIVVSSEAYKYGHIEFDDYGEIKHPNDGTLRYFQTKLMNCLFAQDLSRRVRKNGVTVFSVMPGIVNTNIISSDSKITGIYRIVNPLSRVLLWISKTPVEGCQTVVYCAIAPDIEHLSGSYFVECQPEQLLPKACDRQLANKLWQYSESKVKRFLTPP